MLPLLKPRQTVLKVLALVSAAAVACTDSTDPNKLAHSTTPVITGAGRAASVQITSAPTVVEQGARASLSCIVMDARGIILDATKSWKASDTSVVAVSAAGTLVARQPGNSLVTCAADGLSSTAAVSVTESPVDFVEVSPGGGDLMVGNTLQLVGVARDASGVPVSDHPVQWTIDDASIATVSASGAVTTYAEGSATVTAMSGGKIGAATLSVSKGPPAPAASLSLSGVDATLNIGQSTHVDATVKDAAGHNLSNRSIVWSVDDPSIVTAVSKDANTATVIARATGTAVITATCEGITASVSVRVAPPAVQTVSVSLAASTIYPQKTTQAYATLKDANGGVLTDRAVSWKSMNTAIATVSATGLVTAFAAGTVTIRATSEGKNGDAVLTVQAAPVTVASVSSVLVALASSTITQGQQSQAYAVVTDSSGAVLNGQAVTWATTDASIATVSPNGVVTGVAAGAAKIKATVQTRAGEATQMVTAPTQPVATVSVSLASSNLTAGQTTQATAVAKDLNGFVLNGRTVTWSSLNPTIATVSSSGLVTAVAAGSATIRATIDTKTGDAGLTASLVPIATLSVSLGSASLTAGQTTQATAVAKDGNGNVLTGRAVSWSSLNAAVATVSSTGLVTAVGSGSTTIRATAESVNGVAAFSVTAPVTGTATNAYVVNGPSNRCLKNAGWGTPGSTINLWDCDGTTTEIVNIRPAGSTGTMSMYDGVSCLSETSGAEGAQIVIAGCNGSTQQQWTLTTAGTLTHASDGKCITPASGGTANSTPLTVATCNGSQAQVWTLRSVSGTPTVAVASVQVALAASSLTVGQTTQATVTAKDAGGNVLTGRVVAWASLNTAIATVSSTGLVTAVAAGSATIRATVETVNGDATVAVATATVAPVASVTVTLAASSLLTGGATQATAVAKDANGNVLTGRAVAWSSLNTTLATVSSTGVVSALAAGTVTIRATVETKTGDATLTISAPTILPTTASPAELPRVYLNTSVAATPSAGRTLRVLAGGDLQRALDTAVAGDRVLLASGAIFTGNYYLKAKTGGIAGGWITVATDGGSCPAEGSRVTPTSASTFAKLQTPNVNSVIYAVGAAARWRLQCLELTASTSNNLVYGLINLGIGDETSLTNIPSDLIFDRVYVHGHPTLDCRRGFAFNSLRTAVIDSYVSDFHSSFDAQAIGGWNSPGPFKIVNNFLEASTEVINFGGATVSIASVVPSDIEIRRNHITKRMEWLGKWLAKNLIEFKSAGRVLIEGNVMENSYAGGQPGFAFVLWSANQDGACTWCQTFDITIQSNIIRNVSAGFNLAGKYWGAPSPYMARLAIRNNVIIGMANSSLPGAIGRVFQIADGPIPDVNIEHNTLFTPTGSSVIWGGPMPLPNHVVKNNMMGGGGLSLYDGEAGVGTAAWNFVAGTGSTLVGNVFVKEPASMYPSNNFYPATFDDIGLVGGGTAAVSVTATLDQLTLASTSPYKGKGTDGKDPGADIAALKTATANVVIP